MIIIKNIIQVLFILLISQYGNSQVINQKDFTIGESFEIASRVLDENRTINVYLPNSYSQDSAQKYPIIYLLDGSADEDFIHIGGLVQFCSFPWINIMPETIVVGIANVDRKRDFTYPSTLEIDRKEFPSSGKSKQFIEFIEKELQGIIETKYQVTDQKTLMGQSLGGLLATEILLKRPEMFDNFIIISPSLWWDNELLLQKALNKPLKDKCVYIGVGKEGPVMERVAQTLYNKLSIEKKGELGLFYKYFEQQSHGDVLHLAAYDAFEKLFKKEEGKNK